MQLSTHTIIEEYSTDWPEAFARLRSVYRSRLGSYVAGIEHVGSTAVEGLPAKPIIDIDLIIEHADLLRPVIGVLDDLGYDHVGDRGIPGREAFARRSANTPVDGSGSTWPAHHLYVCMAGSLSLKNHLAFRNYLRTHPKEARAYGDLKKRLAAAAPADMDRYVDGKTGFITNILTEMGFPVNALEAIKRQNQIAK